MRFLLIFVFVCCACASEIKDMESVLLVSLIAV